MGNKTVKVELDCGCQATFFDGVEIGTYTFCQKHGDTYVMNIPGRKKPHVSGGERPTATKKKDTDPHQKTLL